MNQCDGCRRHLPIIDGIHMDFGYDMIGCTKDRYTGDRTMDKLHKAIAKLISDNKSLYLSDSGQLILYGDALVNDLADYFTQDNPQFDRERFLTTCGL